MDAINGTLNRVQYGSSTIEYALTFAPRKTLGISVHPNLQVTVCAPEGSDPADVQTKVLKRAAWILRQQRDFARYSPDHPPRLYVGGETHRYLGRQYRLKLIEHASIESVKLGRGVLTIWVRDRHDPQQVKSLLDRWYRKQARRVFEERLAECLPRVERIGVTRPVVMMRAMQSRWGSCTPSGKVLLNVKLIQVPKRLIDYVILHELCHLAEHNHSARFYALLDRVLPDWRVLKHQLDTFEFT